MTAGSSMDVGPRAEAASTRMTAWPSGRGSAVAASRRRWSRSTTASPAIRPASRRDARLRLLNPPALTGVACAAGGARAGRWATRACTTPWRWSPPNGGWTALPLLDGLLAYGRRVDGSSSSAPAVGSTAPTGPDAVTRGGLDLRRAVGRGRLRRPPGRPGRPFGATARLGGKPSASPACPRAAPARRSGPDLVETDAAADRSSLRPAATAAAASAAAAPAGGGGVRRLHSATMTSPETPQPRAVTICATSRSSPTSTTARPPWWTRCSSSRVSSEPT